MIGTWAIRRGDVGLEPIRLEAVDESGSVVGIAWARPDGETHPTIYRAHVEVDPNVRRQGAGTMLLAQLRQETSRLGATSLRMRVDAADAAGIAFARTHGFAERHRLIQSVLRVADVDPLRAQVTHEQLRSQGIVVSTLATDLATDDACLERLHDLVRTVIADIPTGDPPLALPFEEFRATHVDDPAIPHDGYFLARVGERYVGLSYLARIPLEDAIQQALSGVRREYRNRGIARALKLQAIDFALRHGYQKVFASNHSTNPSMLELNRSLGFVPESEQVVLSL